MPCMVKSRLKTCGETKVLFGIGKLNAHQHRFKARDHQKEQRVADVHQPDLLVVDRGDPGVQHLKPPADAACGRRRRLDRRWPGLPWRPSISLQRHQIGGDSVEIVIVEVHRRHQDARLEVRGVVDQCRRFAGVFGTAPEAMVSRLARCVRSGPNLPVATVPATVWQLMQALC